MVEMYLGGNCDIPQLGHGRLRLFGALSGRPIRWNGALGVLGLEANAECSDAQDHSETGLDGADHGYQSIPRPACCAPGA